MSLIQGLALITGSAQGIGRSIALRLARDGFDIALNDLPSKTGQLRVVAEEIENVGRKALLVPADVTVEAEVKGMVQDTVKQLGGVDVMVANAGILQLARLVSVDLEDWERVMAVNVRGPFLCYKYAAQQMIKQGRGGRIIGASSIVGRMGAPLGSAYCASKFAMRGLTQTAALELGQYDITVNCYAPGFIQNPNACAVQSLTKIAAADRELLDTTLSCRGNKIQVIKQASRTENIASIVSYLASSEAHFITGQCITVDGGIVLS